MIFKNKKIFLHNEESQYSLEVLVVSFFLHKMVGLLNHPSLEKGKGILLKKTSSIHSRGMHFSFEAIFLDKKFRIIGISLVHPQQLFVRSPKKTKHILELGIGSAEQFNLQINDQLFTKGIH